MLTREFDAKPQFIGPRTVTVRALTYGAPDTYRTSWKRGVFADSLRSGRTVPACWGHDRTAVVGSVVGHHERDDGLELEIRLADPADVPAARMVASLLRDGHIEGVSVGFADGVTEPDPVHRGVLRFVRAQLQEVSFVTAASVPGAKVLAMRSYGHTANHTAAAAFAHLDHADEVFDRFIAREASRVAADADRREWAQGVVAAAKAELSGRRRTGRTVTVEEIRTARAILDDTVGAHRVPVTPAEPLPPWEPPESIEWRKLRFSATDIDGMFDTPPRSFPPLPDDATPEQIAAAGFDGRKFRLPTPPPQKIPRDLYEAAMSDPAAFPGFDPIRGNGMEIRD